MLRRSLHIGTFGGIPLKLHWTFSLIFVFVFFVGIKNNRDFAEIGIIFLYVLVLFLCVVLHEYGHALMAKRFNVKTIDIILSPIGGLARLERLPSRPIHEFYVAIAGPLVNICIAILLGTILIIFSKPLFPDLNGSISRIDNWGSYLSIILGMNVVLFLFNLIPAFPMDGGRILRSLLSIKLGKKRSTNIASYIGYAIAAGFIIYGSLHSYYSLAIIGVFVMLMARSEKKSAKHEDFLLNNTTALNALHNSKTFDLHSGIDLIIENYVNKNGRNFMIHENGKLCGIVKERDIRKAIATEQTDGPIADFISHSYVTYGISSIQTAIDIMNQFQVLFLVINEEGIEPYLVEKYKVIELVNNT
jgi:Zn-dependent protease